MRKITYTFIPIEKCNMCGEPPSKFKILGKRLNCSQGKNPSQKLGISTTIVKCRNCALVFSDPQPVPDNIQDHYGVPPESYWKEEYFKVEEHHFQAQINRFKKIIPFKEKMRALDIGAGLGHQMIALEKAGFEVYGLEPSKTFYDRAIEKMGINPHRLKLSMLEESFYEDNFLDFINISAVYEHLYDPDAALKQVYNWMKPGALIHIQVPNAAWLINRLANIYYQLRGSDYVANLSPMHPPYHLHEFSLQSFKLNAQINNFKIAGYKYYVASTYMPKLLDPLLKPIMKKTNTGMQLEVWLQK